MKERNKRIAYGVLGIFIFLCIWYAATKFTSLGKVMPDPVTVIAGFCKAFVVPIRMRAAACSVCWAVS